LHRNWLGSLCSDSGGDRLLTISWSDNWGELGLSRLVYEKDKILCIRRNSHTDTDRGDGGLLLLLLLLLICHLVKRPP
jgi:hypothetical protein